MALDMLRKYKVRLELLEQLHREGKVSEQTYQKVRSELISRVVYELRLRKTTPRRAWVGEAKPSMVLKPSRGFSSVLYVPARVIDEHFLARLPSSFYATLSWSSVLILGIVYSAVVIGVYLMEPFYAFIFAMLGSLLLVFQVKIDQRAGGTPNRPRILQKFIMRCSEVPSTPFIVNFMFFLMLAALALAMASPISIADPLAVYAFYFLVIGVGIQLIDYVVSAHK
jgi:hypothetical protein